MFDAIAPQFGGQEKGRRFHGRQWFSKLGGSMGAAGARHTNTQRNRSLSIIDETTTAAPQPQKHNGIPGVVRAEQRHRV
jgi:hypothetical protein